tara:strand:+ start:233 stop:421 length:189 start_codon:yes stop_codon:yes gene_type:complete
VGSTTLYKIKNNHNPTQSEGLTGKKPRKTREDMEHEEINDIFKQAIEMREQLGYVDYSELVF